MFMGICPSISSEIKLQTHSLSFFSLLFRSSKAGWQTLSSHLFTIMQGLIVGDDDWVGKQRWGECQHCSEQYLCRETWCFSSSWLLSLGQALVGVAPVILGA